jgi:hypothetical protein
MNTDRDKAVRPVLELTCGQARKRINALQSPGPQGASGKAVESDLTAHLARCGKCEAEARIARLYQLVLQEGAAAGMATDAPDTAWFRGLRARIEREDQANFQVVQDSFARTMSLVARQMAPVMIVLVLLIVGATLYWRGVPDRSVASNDPVLMNQVVEYPQPTTDDVLGTLLAVEDKKNGK